MTAPSLSSPAVARRAPRSLVVGLGAVAAGVLVQAVLAGLFLSVAPGARLVHTVVGFVLPYLALVVAVVAAVHHARGTARARLAVAVYPLPVLLWLQEVLGHVPAAATTAVHVPLGVLLAVYSTVLAVLATQSRGGG